MVATLWRQQAFFSLSPAGPLGRDTGCKARFHRYRPPRSASLVLGSSALTWWPWHVPAAALGFGSAAPPAAARARPGPAPQAAHLGEWEDRCPETGVGRGGRDECGRRGLGVGRSQPRKAAIKSCGSGWQLRAS